MSTLDSCLVLHIMNGDGITTEEVSLLEEILFSDEVMSFLADERSLVICDNYERFYWDHFWPTNGKTTNETFFLKNFSPRLNFEFNQSLTSDIFSDL
ncbi:unnamed protein product [Hymenolepis diminuta]|uniref:Uncharacterized protein n=1 Tax=Hymenolepis diminuta TaxID=6216 RepID=A0A564YVM8_HYMDI|nr:unnamed protein product [Hymenolepis diminuta]